ncbi:MAG TPA: hypothetical protein VJM11_13655, partial [Nevskiaceae bacterium]|nr:hypothetical protein [Nevskiaceae bacterium]
GIADALLARPAPGRALLAARLHDQLGYTLAYGPAQDNPEAEAHWQRCIDLLRPLKGDGTPQELRYLLQCEGSRLINFGYHATPPEALEPAVVLVTGDGRDARARFPDDREILSRVITGMAASINALVDLKRVEDARTVADEALALAEQAFAFEPGRIHNLRILLAILRDRVALDTRAGQRSPDVLRARALYAADQLAKRDPDNRDSLTMSATAILGLFRQVADDPARRAERLALASRASRTGRLDGAIALDLEPIASLELLRRALQPPASPAATPAFDALRAAIKVDGRSDWDAARAYADGAVTDGDALRGEPVGEPYRWVVRWLRERACARSTARCLPASF